MNWRKPIIYSALYLSGSSIPCNLKEIRRVSMFTDEEKRHYQDKKLEKLLLHASKHVPYYKNILQDVGVVKDGKVNLENFTKIPILTKEIIRREGKRMYSDDKNKRGWYENTSGGSTGEPVRFLQDKQYNDWNIANKIYYKEVGGQSIGEKELRFWGSERDLLEGKETFEMRARNWLYNRKEFNTFKMSEHEMREYIEKWNKFQPSWVEAYVQSIYEFAKFLKANDLKIYSPKNGILTGAGTLYPEMRKNIKEIFSCPVYNRYGSREVGDMACGQDKLSLSFWNHNLEVLDEVGGKSENGKIIVTTLNNYSMPFIRYDIGDVASVAEVKNIFELKKVFGRSMEMFKTRDGKIIPSEFFIHFIGVVYNNNAIAKFQVIQKEYDDILIKVVVRDKKNFNDNRINIENAIKKEMGNNCKINWNFVNDIESAKSGKYLYTICDIK